MTTCFRNSSVSGRCSRNEANSARTSWALYASVLMSDAAAVAGERSGKRKSVPGNGVESVLPKCRNGSNWSGNWRTRSEPAPNLILRVRAKVRVVADARVGPG